MTPAVGAVEVVELPEAPRRDGIVDLDALVEDRCIGCELEVDGDGDAGHECSDFWVPAGDGAAKLADVRAVGQIDDERHEACSLREPTEGPHLETHRGLSPRGFLVPREFPGRTVWSVRSCGSGA